MRVDFLIWKARNLEHSRLEEEVMVIINGPNLAHSKVIAKEGMTNLWAKSNRMKDRQGHFIRRAKSSRLGWSPSQLI